MIAELVKEDKNYTYKLKSNGKVVIESKYYTTKLSAVRGFKNFNRSVKLGRITVCNDTGCYHVEVTDGNNRVIAESVNLGNSARVTRLKNRIRTKPLILNDRETKKMRTYIQNIGDIRLKEPLTVEVVKEDKDYVVSIPHLFLFAYGDDLENSIKELNEDLKRVYNKIFIDKIKVAGNALKVKNSLSRLIDAQL
tara:strand:- start:317 stop:898 length:582 start_codon:yes stop_codon:yes gene_type:complete